MSLSSFSSFFRPTELSPSPPRDTYYREEEEEEEEVGGCSGTEGKKRERRRRQPWKDGDYPTRKKSHRCCFVGMPFKGGGGGGERDRVEALSLEGKRSPFSVSLFVKFKKEFNLGAFCLMLMITLALILDFVVENCLQEKCDNTHAFPNHIFVFLFFVPSLFSSSLSKHGGKKGGNGKRCQFSFHLSLPPLSSFLFLLLTRMGCRRGLGTEFSNCQL